MSLSLGNLWNRCFFDTAKAVADDGEARKIIDVVAVDSEAMEIVEVVPDNGFFLLNISAMFWKC